MAARLLEPLTESRFHHAFIIRGNPHTRTDVNIYFVEQQIFSLEDMLHNKRHWQQVQELETLYLQAMSSWRVSCFSTTLLSLLGEASQQAGCEKGPRKTKKLEKCSLKEQRICLPQ